MNLTKKDFLFAVANGIFLLSIMFFINVLTGIGGFISISIVPIVLLAIEFFMLKKISAYFYFISYLVYLF